jgi:hypothetical protein
MNPSRRREAGQALVIIAIAMLAIIAGMGLIIDGGNAWAQQRITQAGNDAASEAGAIVIAKFQIDPTQPEPAVDAAVDAAVNAAAANNSITVPVAYYTDICGTLLRLDGTKAAGTGDAAQVGGGGLPTNNHTNPDCPGGVVGPVAGVQAGATKNFNSFVSQVIGIGSMTAKTTATAVAGILQGTCSAASGCVVLPVTAPVTVVTCDGSGEATPTSTLWPKNVRVIVPLCKNNPGNVGWLDWTPKGGGASELEASILNPDNPPIDLPSWNYVTATGDTNSKPVEDALNTYDGDVVLFPLFDLTCAEDPDLSKTKVPPNFGCGDIGGSGSNQWYRFPTFAAFELEHAYINGSNTAACDTGNGATSCLIGKFVDFITSGTVGPGVGGGTTDAGVRGVQLIK